MKRNSLKRLMALGMAFVLILTVLVNPDAKASEVDRFGNSPLEEDEDINQLDSSALDETYGFSDEALAAIESLVITDDDNLYHIENEEELRNQLSDEEYSLVLERIAESNASVRASAAGSEKNPYILTPDTTLNTGLNAASNTWFKISDIRGAADFIINCNRAVNVTIYKKVLFGKTKIGSAYGKSVNKTISSSNINNGANTYIINVTADGSNDMYTRVKQHKDSTTTYHPNGGTVWKPDRLSAIPDTKQLTMSIWYLKAEDVNYLSTFINHDDFIRFVDGFTNSTLTAGSIASTIWGAAGGGTPAVVVAIALALISHASSAHSFRSSVINQLKSAGGWNGTKYTKPVCLKEVFTSSAITFYYISTWTGGVLYGAPGYTGTFSQRVP